MNKNIPETIENDDYLGRAVFSSNAFHKERKTIRHKVFLERPGCSISIDRFGFCKLEKLAAIQDKNAHARSSEEFKRSFYGWAKLKAKIVFYRQGRLDKVRGKLKRLP